MSDFVDFTMCIANGNPLPRQLYRKGLDVTTDFSAQKTGVKHIHLGGQNSDVLVFLVEFPDEVAMLEINTHRRFDRDRVGELLVANHALTLAEARSGGLIYRPTRVRTR
ncbi:hypothetical protein AB5I41_24940 [Sphingomonas sp. MMS24-JH45]